MSDLIATFTTARGPIRVRLFADKAPVTVANFVNLVQRGYYNKAVAHAGPALAALATNLKTSAALMPVMTSQAYCRWRMQAQARMAANFSLRIPQHRGSMASTRYSVK